MAASFDAHRFLVERCKAIGDQCMRLGSPMYAKLLEEVADDVERGGSAWRLLRDKVVPGGGIPLRLMAAVHRLVLSGEAPRLAGHYPSVGGQPGNSLWADFHDVLIEHDRRLDAELDRPVQTNEVARAPLLFAGLHALARTSTAPIRLLELGASAGLNQLFDSHCYVGPAGRWGSDDAPLRFEVPLPDLRDGDRIEVIERRGCDQAPIDAATEEGRQLVRSFVWADQEARMRRLHAAIELAVASPPSVDRADAVAWLADQLAAHRAGVTTVVFESQLLRDVEGAGWRSALRAIIDDAAERNGGDIAWLRFEPVSITTSELWLERSSAAEPSRLARASHFGYPFAWLHTEHEGVC